MTRRIHIVGSSPRTGTTLAVELLLNAFVIDGWVEHEQSIFEPPDRDYRVFLTKRPNDVLVAAPLLRIDPDLWILHMVRDPRDIVVSRHDTSPDVYWTNLGVWKWYRPAARRAEGHPHFLTLRYEDLVGRPHAVQEKVARFLPFLERRGTFSEFHESSAPSEKSLRAMRGLRPITRESIGAWRRHRPRLVAQIERHGPIDRDLVELGYEPDAKWRRELDGVEPAAGTSVLAGRWTLRERMARSRRQRRRIRRYTRRLRERS